MIIRNFILMDCEYAGLAWKFQVNPDSCDNPGHYQQYISLCAISDQKSGRGTTHILLETNQDNMEQHIIGFLTLKATSLIMDCDGYEQGHPALEISELAVDKNYERQGVGTYLVKSAIVIASEMNDESVGIEYITLCADPKAVEFYSNRKLGFKGLRQDFKLPYEDWNINCFPMAMKLPKLI